MSTRVGKRIAVGVVTLAIAVLGLVLAPFALSSRSEAAGQGFFVYHANGDYARVSISQPQVDPDKWWSSCETYVDVMRGGVGARMETALSYLVTNWDPDKTWFSEKEGQWYTGQCVPVQSGYGTIPNAAYRASARTQSLNIDTSASIPGFTREAGSGGVISVTWLRTGQSLDTSSGTSMYSYGDYTSRWSGTRTNASASASGTIVGTPIAYPTTNPDLWGFSGVGSNRGVTICTPVEPGQDCSGK